LTESLSPTLRKAVSCPAAHESTAGKPFVPFGSGSRQLVVTVRYDIKPSAFGAK
jgi:hypothetical protein